MEHLDQYSVEYLRTWLSNRRQINDDIDHYQSNVIIHPNDELRAFDFPDLYLDRYKNPSANKLVAKVDLNQLFKWMNEFVKLLRSRRAHLETIELMRNGFNKRLSRYQVQEAINLIQCALVVDVGLDIEVSRIVDCILIEDSSTPTHEILRQICVRLFTQCPVKVVAKVSHYYTCLATAFLLDLMEEAGFPVKLIELLAYDHKRDSTPTSCSPFQFATTGPAGGDSSGLVSCGSNTSQACKSIIESYLLLQRQYPNLVVFVEESVYDQFLDGWQMNFVHLVTNCSLDDTGRGWPEIQVDLNSIDIKSAHRMTGNCINVIKFRSIEELCKLLNKLRKVPYMQLWTSDHLFSRELCLSSGLMNQCDHFWLNHYPQSLTGRLFTEHLIKFYKLSMRRHMNDVYTDLFYSYEDEIERLRRMQVSFMNKKSFKVRTHQVVLTYLNLISKFKSMKQTTMSIAESIARLKRFQLNWLNPIGEMSTESRIESTLRPIGLAILVIRNESCIKSKSVLVEFIFKNLILGNGVLLLCPQSLLGLRFPISMMERFDIPFAMVNLNATLPPINEFSQLTPTASEHRTPTLHISLQSTDSGLNDSFSCKKPLKCPKGVFAVDFKQGELTSDQVETMIIALGSMRRSIWYPDCYQHCSQFSESDEY